MKKIRIVICLIALLISVTACTANDKTTSLPIVTADIHIPEKINPNEIQKFSVKVTQESLPIEDAEVQFEIWHVNSHSEEAVTLPATYDKDGFYSVNKEFDHDGLYYIQAYVQANGLNVMPKKIVAVGNVSEVDWEAVTGAPNKPEEHHNHH